MTNFDMFVDVVESFICPCHFTISQSNALYCTCYVCGEIKLLKKKIRSAILNDVIGAKKGYGNHWLSEILEKWIVSVVAADCIAPLGARLSAGTVVAKTVSPICTGCICSTHWILHMNSVIFCGKHFWMLKWPQVWQSQLINTCTMLNVPC